MKKLLIASTSTLHGQPYLHYLRDDIHTFFSGCRNIVFIPFARPGGISWTDYTSIAKKAFEAWGFRLVGIHEKDMHLSIEEADGIFTGGGNTFVLLNSLYELNLLDALRKRVENGLPYMGSSAGSNITGPSIRTTNDMPIVYPPSFEALNLVPFNINPHYQDPDPNSLHMGETRETRIKEFLVYNDRSVIGLREGSHLIVEDEKVELRGKLSARFFHGGKVEEVPPGDFTSFISNH